MKAGIKVPIIIDRTFGFGVQFELCEAQITAKTIVAGTTQRRKGSTFAKATRELAIEMTAINKLANELLARARAFKDRLKAAPKGDEPTP